MTTQQKLDLNAVLANIAKSATGVPGVTTMTRPELDAYVVTQMEKAEGEKDEVKKSERLASLKKAVTVAKSAFEAGAATVAVETFAEPAPEPVTATSMVQVVKALVALGPVLAVEGTPMRAGLEKSAEGKAVIAKSVDYAATLKNIATMFGIDVDSDPEILEYGNRWRLRDAVSDVIGALQQAAQLDQMMSKLQAGVAVVMKSEVKKGKDKGNRATTKKARAGWSLDLAREDEQAPKKK